MTQSGQSDANASWTCTDVRAHIYEFIDGALPADVHERMREHIAACGHCRPSFERERDFLDLLARRCKVEPCPGELRQRIIDSLSQARRRPSGEA
ncbi:MAG TPA: mycothiol system anti-sigma-R factor [Gemmatimonadaceae bacterium]|nr:mycothiol system anti-sigma-R factor [Gemmatimonadaceae bacterium]